MRYQWIARFLANPLVDTDAVMAPFARQVLERQASGGEPLALILDQSKDLGSSSGSHAGGLVRRPGAAAGLAGRDDRGGDRLRNPEGASGHGGALGAAVGV